MADGKVVYKVELDKSSVKKDLTDVNSEIKNGSKKTSDEQKKTYKETTTEFEKQSNKIVDANKDANKKIKSDSKDTSIGVQDAFEAAAEGIGISFTSLTAAGTITGIAAVTAKAVSDATQFDTAMNQFASSTGTSTDELKKYEDVLKNIYGNNYGDDFMDIASAMGEVKKQLGDLDEATLQNLTESAFALRDTFDFDVTESVRTAKNMMDNFGIDGQAAMNLIANGAQSNINKNGDLLDVLNEYSVQFRKLGFSADDMFKMLEAGADNGAFSVDKVGDAVKEFSIRVVDGSDTTKEGFEKIGLNADQMAEKFAKGGDSAKEAFNQTVEALMKVKDPMEQNLAGVNLFGTMWEDLGPQVIGSLAGIEEGAYGTADAMDTIKSVKYDDLGSMFEALTRQLELLLLPLGEMLIPLLSQLITAILPVMQALLPVVAEVLGALVTPILEIIQALTPLISLIADLAIPVIQLLGSVFGEVLNGAAADTKSIIGNVIGIIQGLLTFIQGVFTGNWKMAWNGVKQIFSNIVNALGEIFKKPINFIIDIINGFIKGLNKIKIPDWVPKIGGKGINIPKIPRLKVGMDFVPSDFFPAYLDYGEAVLTKEENAKLRSLGGIAGIERMINANQFISAESIDYALLAEAMAGVSIPIYLDGKLVGYSVTGAVDQNMGIITTRKGRYGI